MNNVLLALDSVVPNDGVKLEDVRGGAYEEVEEVEKKEIEQDPKTGEPIDHA